MIFYIAWRRHGFVSQFGAKWEDGTYVSGDTWLNALLELQEVREFSDEFMATASFTIRQTGTDKHTYINYVEK